MATPINSHQTDSTATVRFKTNLSTKSLTTLTTICLLTERSTKADLAKSTTMKEESAQYQYQPNLAKLTAESIMAIKYQSVMLIVKVNSKEAAIGQSVTITVITEATITTKGLVKDIGSATLTKAIITRATLTREGITAMSNPTITK